MKVERSFTVARPLDDVWAFFQDIPTVAACMPGAQLTGEQAPGRCSGKVSLKLGPFSAGFEGEASVTFDQAGHCGRMEGRGVDKRGGSRSRVVVAFDVAAASAEATEVHVDADLTLSGPIAQFGRTGIVQETANILIGDFVRNLEARLAPSPAVSAHPKGASGELEPGVTPETERATVASGVSAGRLMLLALTAWFRRLFGRQAAL